MLMYKSTLSLDSLLATLTAAARRRGMNDTQWARAAGVRKETLSRVRGRASCDFATLAALASVVGARIGMTEQPTRGTSPDAHFPQRLDRAYEARLLDLCAQALPEADQWREAGPAFFMAGLAVMLASVSQFDRRACLDLAERLHPGSSQTEVFALWLRRSPLRPSRFLPLLAARLRRAA
jgi:DNA-binding phage protein